MWKEHGPAGLSERFTPSRWSFKADLNFELFGCYLLTLDLTSVRLLMLLCNKVVIHSFIHFNHTYLALIWGAAPSQRWEHRVPICLQSADAPGAGGGELSLGRGGQDSFVWRGGIGVGKRGLEMRWRKGLPCRVGAGDTVSEGAI